MADHNKVNPFEDPNFTPWSTTRSTFFRSIT